MSSNPHNFKVSLRGPAPFGGMIQVTFEASSPVTESRSANYVDGYNIVHLPTDILAYRNTSGRKFGVTGKLVSRTQDEARTNAYLLNCVRRWILPDFGNSGATPPIVYFSAYKSQNIDELSTIIRSYSWTFVDDVDYIFATDDGDFEPMPIIGTLSLEVDEIYSAAEITAKKWEIKINPLPDEVDVQGGNRSTIGSASKAMYYNFGYRDKYKFPGIATGLFGIPGLPSVGQILNTGGKQLDKAVQGLQGIFKSGSQSSSSPQITDVTKSDANNPVIDGPGLANPPADGRWRGSSESAQAFADSASDFERSSLPPPTYIEET